MREVSISRPEVEVVDSADKAGVMLAVVFPDEEQVLDKDRDRGREVEPDSVAQPREALRPLGVVVLWALRPKTKDAL